MKNAIVKAAPPATVTARRLPAVAVEIEGAFASAPVAVAGIDGDRWVLLTSTQRNALVGFGNDAIAYARIETALSISYDASRRQAEKPLTNALFIPARATLILLAELRRERRLSAFVVEPASKCLIGLMEAALDIPIMGTIGTPEDYKERTR